MIKKGDTIKRINDVSGDLPVGTICKALSGGKTLIKIKGYDGLYDPDNFKKVKGAEMNNIEQLKKEHKEMGETIKRMEEEEAKPVWCAGDIRCGVRLNCSDDDMVIAEYNFCSDKALFNIIEANKYFNLESNISADEMADYLNENNFQKA